MAVAIRSVCRPQVHHILKNLGSRYQQSIPCIQSMSRGFSNAGAYNRLLSEMRFSKDHDWVRREGTTSSNVTVGITNYAQDQLGDIVFVELPEVGSDFEEGGLIGIIESVKAATDLYSPLGGNVTDVNTGLSDAPELVNKSPYDEGWLYKMELADPSSFDTLMKKEEYEQFMHDQE